MSVTQQMTEMADAAGARYQVLLDSWRSIYQRQLNGSQLDPRMIEAASLDARRIAVGFLNAEVERLTNDADGIASEAYTETLHELGVTETDELTEAVSELLNAIEQYIKREIHIQIERDIAFLEESLRRTLLQVSVAARAQGTTPRMALVQYQIGNAQEIAFFFHDRRGAKWPSRKFIRGVYRHGLLAIYNETVLLTLADHGETLAEVVHVDRHAASDGTIIAMASNSDHPTYSEIRNEVFHPNSDAILRKVA